MTIGNICSPSFSLGGKFLESYKDKQPEWGPLGYAVYKRTYARNICSTCSSYNLDYKKSKIYCPHCTTLVEIDSHKYKAGEITTEEWWQTCNRVVSGTFSIQKNHCQVLRLPWSNEKAQRTAQHMFQAMWEFKFLPPGRGLWTMGTNVLKKVGGTPLNNCAMISTKDLASDPVLPFTFLMDVSMLGVGVGFDTLGAGTVRITQPSSYGKNYTIPDTREGWVEAVAHMLRAYLAGGPLYTYDFSEVREAGQPIRGFGGVSSGPWPLRKLLDDINSQFCTRIGELITSTDIVDIQNLIGKCVISGNVRRSAEIALGLPEDEDFVKLKRDYDKLQSHRWVSNNSILASQGMDYSFHASISATNGEPGYIWLDNMKQFGRMKDPADNKDYRVVGVNPCSEQSLESFELCCLVETFPSRHKNLKEYLDTLKLAYLYAKTVTLVPTHWLETNAVMMRNRRIGCSMSGVTNAFDIHGRREVLRWCDISYDFIKGLDKQYSQWLCIPESIKKTSVKPSGTVSLLPPNVNPGIHRGPAEYYIRRMRLAKNSELVKRLSDAGYPVEPDVRTPEDTMVVSFPVYDSTFTVAEEDVSMWEQLEIAAQMQHYWADNCVSVTVKFKPEEASQIKNALELYESRLKAVSFLPSYPLQENKYEQMPLEKINAETYQEMVSKINPDKLYGSLKEAGDGGKTLFCDSDKCELT